MVMSQRMVTLMMGVPSGSVPSRQTTTLLVGVKAQ